jgi:hypothetical protein
VKQALAFFDGLFTVVSPLMLAGLVCATIVWGFERAPSINYVQTDQTLIASAGESIHLQSTFTTQVDASRVVYHIWIEDQHGDSRYVFPDMLVKDPTDISLAAIGDLSVPTALVPGTYLIQVEAVYPFNPLKNGTIFITAATLVVPNK